MKVGLELCGLGHGLAIRHELAGREQIRGVDILAVVADIEIVQLPLGIRAQMGALLHHLHVIFLLQLAQTHSVAVHIRQPSILNYRRDTLWQAYE